MSGCVSYNSLSLAEELSMLGIQKVPGVHRLSSTSFSDDSGVSDVDEAPQDIFTSSFTSSDDRAMADCNQNFVKSPVTPPSYRQSLWPCECHPHQQKEIYCDNCAVPLCKLCWVQTHFTHTVSSLLVSPNANKPYGRHRRHVHRLTTDLLQLRQLVTDYQTDVASSVSAASASLQQRRDHYHSVVDRWYWKQRLQLDSLSSSHKVDTDALLAKLARTDDDVHAMHRARTDAQLSAQMQQLRSCVAELQQLQRELPAHTSYVLSRGQLTSDLLGQVLPAASTSSPRLLHQFDTRNGEPSDYLATGLSVTSGGALLVTDTGLDTLKLFSTRGQQLCDFSLTPESCPTQAVQFSESLVAVACSDSVKLYNLSDGIHSDLQLQRGLERPQGVALNSAGDLVVSAYQVDMPVLAVYDKQTLKLTNIIPAANLCFAASDDNLLLTDDDAALFDSPWYISVTASDDIIVSDRSSHKISVVSPTGELVDSYGGLGSRVGSFLHPAGSCVDSLGRVLVADSQNHRVQLLIPGASSPAVVLLDGDSDDLECPMDLALDSCGRLFVLQGDGVVKVFRY